MSAMSAPAGPGTRSRKGEERLASQEASERVNLRKAEDESDGQYRERIGALGYSITQDGQLYNSAREFVDFDGVPLVLGRTGGARDDEGDGDNEFADDKGTGGNSFSGFRSARRNKTRLAFTKFWASIKRNPYNTVVTLATLTLAGVVIAFFAGALAAFPLTIAVVAFVGVVGLATLVTKLLPNALRMYDKVSVLDWVGFQQWLEKNARLAYDTFRKPGALFGVLVLAAGAGVGAYFALPLLLAVAGVSGPLAIAGLVIGMAAAVVGIAYLSMKLGALIAHALSPDKIEEGRFVEPVKSASTGPESEALTRGERQADDHGAPRAVEMRVIASVLPAHYDFTPGDLSKKVADEITRHNSAHGGSMWKRAGDRIAAAFEKDDDAAATHTAPSHGAE